MVITRSQSGVEDTRSRVFNDPPRSPSTIVTVPPQRGPDDATIPPGMVHPATEQVDVRPSTTSAFGQHSMERPELRPSTAPIQYRDVRPSAHPSPAFALESYRTEQDGARPSTAPALYPYRTRLNVVPSTSKARSRAAARSTRSTTSAAARLRFEAEERLAVIRKKELQIEAELIQKKLAADLAELEDDDSVPEEGNEPIENIERVHAWLNETGDAAATEQGEPNVRPVPEPIGTTSQAQRIETFTPQRRARFDWKPTPQHTETRKRSPTPRSRGIERLASTLEKMMSTRPPPRQATDLPIFSGSSSEWIQFAAAMKETTKVYKFTTTENLARLRNCLRGEARAMVTPLLSAATHPDIIMKTLEQCYGRPEILLDLAFEDVRRLPRMGPSAMDLNAFAVKVQNIVAVLKNVDRSYLYYPLLVREVLEKISPHVKSKWCDYAEEYHSDDADIVKLATFLMREADRALKHGFCASQQKREPPRITPRQEVKKKLTYTATTSNNEDDESCPACNQTHALPDCQKFKNMNADERWEIVKKEGLCFKCIVSRHRRSNCRKKTCGTEGCRRPHHQLLHTTKKKETNSIRENEVKEAATDAATVTTTATHSDVKLKICRVTVAGKHGSVDTYALFDEGSTITLVDDEIAQQIGATGPTTQLEVRGINTERRDMKSRHVRITVRGTNSKNSFNIAARTMSKLELKPQSIPAEVLQLRHLSNLKPEDIIYTDVKPKLLIGTDNWPLIITRELRCNGPKEPAASRTELGWVIHGAVKNVTFKNNHDIWHITTNATGDELLEALVTNHFEIDALGVSLTSKHVKIEDKRAVDIFENTVRHINGRYEVGLPWRKDEIELPPSYNAALKRLKNLEARLEKYPDEKKQYHVKIRNMIEKGYAERCDGTEKDSPRAWYLPHFAVRNPNKPGKVRVVLDAAAKTHGTCLNDHLLQGPDLLRRIIGIMFRFREGAYAITADIEEMFLRVKIKKEDQPAQMFLWRERPTDTPCEYKMTSMIFGASSSPFLAHSVRNKNAYNHRETHPAALLPITESHYMDDFVESFDDVEQGKEVIKQVNEVHMKADFHLRGWNSNNKRLLEIINKNKRAEITTTTLGGTEKMLGLLWNSETDDLSFNTALHKVPETVRSRSRPPTKREALSTIMSIYDPLGLLSCYTISAKITLQKLWRLKCTWDEAVPEDIAIDFDTWLAGLQSIRQLQIHRSYNGGSDICRRELHIFCDASEDAYATAAYWRMQLRNGEIKTVLVAARAKVAPLKTQTIPRLELQAALIGTRLAKTIKEDHRIRIDDVYYWSDSQTVLHWLRNGSRRYTPFVAHRLGEITETSKATDWRWVPTHMNVADLATRRGYIPSEEDVWFNGPEFLKQSKSEWPRWEAHQDEIQEEEVHVITEKKQDSALPNIERFSSYDRLIGATAQVLLFIQRCRNRTITLSQEHIQKATLLWIHKAQAESFAQELQNVRKGLAVPKSSPLRRYDLIIEDGLLKINGRINQADVSSTTKRPIVLNGRHQFTKLLVARAHKRAGHANSERVVNDLRQQYFIIRLRPTVKSVAATCEMCRLRKRQPTTPPMGDLPKERLYAYKRPFSSCGIDYFGPVIVTIGRRHEKRWVALFVCMTTRAIHLELVSSLSTDSAIMAIRRMAARRGWPAVMYSDNGTNFRGADVELKKAYKEWLPELTRTGLTYGMSWKFIAPGAPNQGGAWERMVRSVKTALSSTLQQKAPKEEVLATLLTEAEHTVNSRPLTHVSVDPEDPESLTPNHFLLGSSTGLPYIGPCSEADRKTWRAVQALAENFWRRWMHEYLPTLVPRSNNNKRWNDVHTGDVVIIADSNLPRNVWPRGIITRTFPGPDGVTRNVEVATRGGNFRRPTSKLIVLSSTALSPDQRERTRCTSVETP